jgi:hypothetical protein
MANNQLVKKEQYSLQQYLNTDLVKQKFHDVLREVSPLHAVTIEIGKNEVETIKHPEKWLAVINATYQRYEKGVGAQILRDRYKGESPIKTCVNNFISRTTYYSIVTEIDSYALMCACQMGLVRVF